MAGFDDFFDTPKFDFDKEKQLFVENLDMLKNMPVQEQTLYKKWKEVNGYYRNAMDKARIVKAKIWTPTDLTIIPVHFLPLLVEGLFLNGHVLKHVQVFDKELLLLVEIKLGCIKEVVEAGH